MTDYVEFLPQHNATPPIGTKIHTYEASGLENQAVVPVDSTGVPFTITNPLPTSLPGEHFIGTLGSLNSVIDISTVGKAGTVVFQVEGTWKGKIVIEGAVDGTYTNLSIVQPGGIISFAGVNNDNMNGIYRALLISAYTHVRLRMSTYTSGEATITINTAQNIPTPFVWQLNHANLLGTMKITDGTDEAEVIAGAFTGVKGLRVYGGPTDPISDIPVMIDFDHHQIHEGETWQYCSYGALNATTRDFRIVVPSVTATTRTPHFLPEVICDCTTTLVYLYEGTTWTSSGTDDSSKIFNRNRNVLGSAGTTIYISGGTALTPLALGTLLHVGYLSASAGKGAVGSERALAEWDLKSNTEYLFRVTTTGNGNCLIRLNWYEDTGV